MSTEALMFCATGGRRSVECATFSPQAEIIIRTSFAVGQKQKRHLFCLRRRRNQCPRCLTTSYASERAFQVVFGGYNHALIVFLCFACNTPSGALIYARTTSMEISRKVPGTIFFSEDLTMCPPGSWRVVFTPSHWPRAMWWSADRNSK